MKKRGLLILAIAVCSVPIIYMYINKPHRNISEEKAIAVFRGSDLYTSFSTDKKSFNKKNLDQTLIIQGQITSLEENGLVLNDRCYILFKNSGLITTLKNNQSIAVKGRYVGYDDLLERLKIDQASLINN